MKFQFPIIKQKQIAHYGIYLLIFLLPIQTRYFLVNRLVGGGFFEYGSFTVYATEILLWCLAIWKIISYFRGIRTSAVVRFHKRVFLLFREHPVIVWGALFFFYSALSILWTVNREQTFFYIIRLGEALLIIWLVQTKGLSKQFILTSFILGVLAQSLLGVYQFFTQEVKGSSIFGIAPQIPETRGTSVVETELRRYLRAYGGLPHPNILGGWIAAGLIALVALLYNSARRTSVSLRLSTRPWLLFAYAIFFTALILTFSRSAWLAFFSGGGLLIVYGIFKQRIRRVAVELLVITAIISLFFGILLKEPLTERGRGLIFNDSAGRLERKSTEERNVGFSEAWMLYKKNPLFGSGLGTYTTALSRAYPERSVYAIQPVHAAPALILAELGGTGIFFALLVLYHIAAYLFRNRHSVGIALLVAFLAISVSDHYLWTLYSGIMLVGFCFGIMSDENKNSGYTFKIK